MRFIDRYFYKPNVCQKILSFILLPISAIYYVSSIVRRKLDSFADFEIPIISVGNLIAGGTGKTPFIIEVAKDYNNIAIISRGYKRKSKGLVVVSQNGEILCSQKEAGDEAFLIAKNLKNASVIVSKKRQEAIKKAKEMGSGAIFLDDGFRFNFKKLNILLKPKLEPYFKLCIPSGIYRERPSLYKTADILAVEGIDYKRNVNILNQTQKMLLVTAIANPSRLDEYLPNVVGKITLKDHSEFDIKAIELEVKKHRATSILITQKDEVKLQKCPIPLSIMQLQLQINPSIKKTIKEYIESYGSCIKPE